VPRTVVGRKGDQPYRSLGMQWSASNRTRIAPRHQPATLARRFNHFHERRCARGALIPLRADVVLRTVHRAPLGFVATDVLAFDTVHLPNGVAALDSVLLPSAKRDFGKEAILAAVYLLVRALASLLDRYIIASIRLRLATRDSRKASHALSLVLRARNFPIVVVMKIGARCIGTSCILVSRRVALSIGTSHTRMVTDPLLAGAIRFVAQCIFTGCIVSLSVRRPSRTLRTRIVAHVLVCGAKRDYACRIVAGRIVFTRSVGRSGGTRHAHVVDHALVGCTLRDVACRIRTGSIVVTRLVCRSGRTRHARIIAHTLIGAAIRDIARRIITGCNVAHQVCRSGRTRHARMAAHVAVGLADCGITQCTATRRIVALCVRLSSKAIHTRMVNHVLVRTA